VRLAVLNMVPGRKSDFLSVSRTNAQASQPPPGQVTVFGLEANEALFLTQTANPFAVTEVALDSVVQVFGVDITDGFVDHGTFNGEFTVKHREANESLIL
jgi:hypothetical protein